MKKRIISFLLVAAMLLTCVTVFATETANEIAVGTTFTIDLSMEKTVSDYFQFAGYKKADGTLVELETETRPIWGTWPGYWVNDPSETDGGVFGESENSTLGIIIDMMSRSGAYMPAVVFTAPADGVYDIYFYGIKYQGSTDGAYIDLFLYKYGEDEPIASQEDVHSTDDGATGSNGAGCVVFDVNGIALSKGEKIVVVSDYSRKNYRGGGCNFGVINFEATYVAAEGGSAHGDYAEGTVYAFDLDSTKKAGDHYKLAALKADGTYDYLEYTSRKCSWSDEYIAWYPNGLKSVFIDTQYWGGNNKKETLDMTPRTDVSPVVVFTAPISGIYSFDAVFAKLNISGTAAGYKIEAIYDGEVIASHTFGSATGLGKQEITFAKDDILLGAGETVQFVASYVSDGTNSSEISIPSIEFTLEKAYISIDHVSDLKTTKTVNGPFCIGAYSISDGSVLEVETTPRATWSGAAEEYWGNFIKGINVAVTQGTESTNADARFDMHYRENEGYNAAVVFTAPADGVFNFESTFEKVGQSVPVLVTAVTSDGTVILSKELTTGKERINLDADFVKLSKGEQIIIMVAASENYTEGQRNVAFVSFDVNGSYAECPHVYENGSVCDVCGAQCEHKWTCADETVICVNCGANKDVFHITHSAEIDIYNPVKGNFAIMGLRIEDGVLLPVEDEPSATWSPDYPGNWIVGADHSVKPRWAVTQKNETTDASYGKFTMYGCGDGAFASVVAFEAPEDGYFTAKAVLRKQYAGDPKAVLMTEDGEVYATHTFTSAGEYATLIASDVALAQGEKLFIAVYAPTDGNSNTCFISYEVDGYYDVCPHDFNGDDTCDACEYVCEVHEWIDGECFFCDTVCDHDWNDGVCGNCYMECQHDVTADDATCQAAAVCTICGHEVAPKNASNHASDEFTYVNLGNGTHEKHNACCNALVGTEDCTYVDYACQHCGYHDEVAELTDNANDMITDFFTNGEITGEYIEAVGPAAGALDNYATAQNGTADGFTYAQFNLVFIDGKAVLRNHFIITGDVTVTLNDNAVELKNDECPETVYYLDIVLEAGQYDDTQTIKAGDAEITVSLYSYIKVALEKGVSGDQETILRALYDLNEAAN